MPKRNQADHSRGDARSPYSDAGGRGGRHEQTHDVRREAETNPGGPEPPGEAFPELASAEPIGVPAGHIDESTPAAEDKALHNRLQHRLSADELARLPILDEGARLEQGGTYLDLEDIGRGPFKAIGGQRAGRDNRHVAKRDIDYELWNRLADAGGEADHPEVERPTEAR